MFFLKEDNLDGYGPADQEAARFLGSFRDLVSNVQLGVSHVTGVTRFPGWFR